MFKYLSLALLSLVSFAQITTLPPASGSGGGGATRGYGLTGAGDVFDVNTGVIQPIDSAIAGTAVYCRPTNLNDTYTCNLAQAATAYTTGMCVTLNPVTANTGGATLEIDALGAKNILTRALATLSTGDIPANINTIVCYDGTQFTPAVGGGGTTVAKNGLYLTIGSTDYLADTMFAVTKPSQTGWSWTGTSGTESFGSDGSMVLTGVTSTRVIRAKSLSSATSAIVAFRCDATTNTASYSDCSVFLREASTGKGPVYQYSLYGSVSAPYGVQLFYQKWITDSYSANIFASPITDTTAIIKMDWSTTNVVTSRWTGSTWRQIDSTAKSSLFTTAPDQITFSLGSQGTANIMTILSLELL